MRRSSLYFKFRLFVRSVRNFQACVFRKCAKTYPSSGISLCRHFFSVFQYLQKTPDVLPEKNLVFLGGSTNSTQRQTGPIPYVYSIIKCSLWTANYDLTIQLLNLTGLPNQFIIITGFTDCFSECKSFICAIPPFVQFIRAHANLEPVGVKLTLKFHYLASCHVTKVSIVP